MNFAKKLEKRKFVEAVKKRFNLKNKYAVKRLLFFGTLIVFSVWLFWGVPLPTQLSSELPVSTKLYDRNGKLIYEIYTEKRRSPIDLADIPENVKEATIAIEDKDFYRHTGFSFTGIARAAYNTVFKQKLQGGSTLTQQLVKNGLLTQERTIRRKMQEAALTLIVEVLYTKDQILEMYLNQIPYGSTAYGIDSAANLYFGKTAKDLTLAEAALLAGLPASPSKYSPFGANPQLAKERQEIVLGRMVEDGYISQEEADTAKAQELAYAEREVPKAPHFALWVKETLAEKYGEKVVEQGGLRVTTTLDLELQEFAQEAVATEVAKLTRQKVGNGAALVTRPGSGEILAMVGSKDYFATDEDGKVNIIFRERQPGSSIKPLNYALAIKDKKLTAGTVIADIPTCFAVAGQAAYCPDNYDRTFHGAVPLRHALGNSYNIPAVKVLYINKVTNFIDFARSVGITTFQDPSRYGLSLTLGGGEVRPYDMATAFGVFANQGIKQEPIAILKVEDWRGKVLEETKIGETEEEGERAIGSDVAFIISHILSDNGARTQAFGERSFLNVSGHPEVSVKTGTTNDRRDNWTIGYTGHILVVTWVGNNSNEPMGGAVSGVSGASPIWNKIIKFALDRAEKGTYNQNDDGHATLKVPEGVVGTNICASTGGLPGGSPDTPDCTTRFEYFLKGTVPSEPLGERRDIYIDKTIGTIATDKTPPENVEMQNHPVYFDPTGAMLCLDCPIATGSATTIR